MRILGLIFAMTVLLAGVTVKNACAATDTEDWSEAPETKEPLANAVWSERRLSLAAQLGVQAPLGLMGVELEYAPLTWLSVGGGVGRTLTGNIDWETAAGLWVTPRFVFDASALGVDVGVSASPYDSFEYMEEHAPWASYPLAGWLNVAGQYEYLSDGGFLFRTFLGAATLLNPAEGHCDDGDGNTVECKRLVLGYGGVALGFAFPTHGGAQ